MDGSSRVLLIVFRTYEMLAHERERDRERESVCVCVCVCVCVIISWFEYQRN